MLHGIARKVYYYFASNEPWYIQELLVDGTLTEAEVNALQYVEKTFLKDAGIRELLKARIIPITFLATIHDKASFTLANRLERPEIQSLLKDRTIDFDFLAKLPKDSQYTFTLCDPNIHKLLKSAIISPAAILAMPNFIFCYILRYVEIQQLLKEGIITINFLSALHTPQAHAGIINAWIIAALKKGSLTPANLLSCEALIWLLLQNNIIQKLYERKIITFAYLQKLHPMTGNLLLFTLNDPSVQELFRAGVLSPLFAADYLPNLSIDIQWNVLRLLINSGVQQLLMNRMLSFAYLPSLTIYFSGNRSLGEVLENKGVQKLLKIKALTLSRIIILSTTEQNKLIRNYVQQMLLLDKLASELQKAIDDAISQYLFRLPQAHPQSIEALLSFIFFLNQIKIRGKSSFWPMIQFQVIKCMLNQFNAVIIEGNEAEFARFIEATQPTIDSSQFNFDSLKAGLLDSRGYHAYENRLLHTSQTFFAHCQQASIESHHSDEQTQDAFDQRFGLTISSSST